MAVMFITHVSCKKETGSIGLNAGDAALQPLVLDTFSLLTRTVMEDSLRSENTTYQLLGATRTIDFGYSSSSLALSFALPSSSFTFPAGVVIDSVVFQAIYTGPEQYAGNLATPMAFNISELDERLYIDSAYYSNRQFQSKNPQLYSNIIHDLDDSVKVIENAISRAYAPHMRINLGQAVVDKFKNAQAADLGSNTAFQNYFNGLKVEVDGSGLSAGNGNIVYLNFNTFNSGLAVYFNDTGKYVFPVVNNGAKVNLYKSDFSGIAPIQAQLADTTGNFDITYVQSLAGLKTRIDVPGLLNLVDNGAYAIVDAQFRFYYDKSLTSTEFPAFNRMLLVKRNGNNHNDFVADQAIKFNIFYGGTKSEDSYYEFHITREIQDIINNYRLNGLNLNTGFFLIVPSDKPVSGSHMKMDMQKNTLKGVKLVVTVVKTK